MISWWSEIMQSETRTPIANISQGKSLSVTHACFEMIVPMNNLAQSPKKTCPKNRLANPIVNTNTV
jgi:hypothetical protein